MKNRERRAIYFVSARDYFRLVVQTLKSMLVLPWGLLTYKLTGRTPRKAYSAYIWLFCVTRGWLNDALALFVSLTRSKIRISETEGILGDVTNEVRSEFVSKLNRDGYVVFDQVLSEEICQRLMNFARQTKSRARTMDVDPTLKVNVTGLFDLNNPKAVRYEYDTSDLLNNPDVQSILADPSILNIVQEYLGCQPVADVLGMWWHTNLHAQPDAEAAQFYHFDIDRIKWLKVFIYLTDVGVENGPHSFVVGSHRSGGIPWSMLRRGYVRLTDEEVFDHYGKKRCIQVTAPRGSIIIEDTRGLHKGSNVSGSPRLILQLQFSNSLFGTNYPVNKFASIESPDLQKLINERPSIYRQYIK